VPLLRHLRAPALALTLLLALVLGLLGVSATGPASAGGTDAADGLVPVDQAVTTTKDPRKRLGLFVDPLMPAAQQGKRYKKIANKAQALWLGNEYYPTDQVKDIVKAYTKRAKDAGKTPMLVVYSIPDRDCGQYSAGGLPGGKEYKQWIRQVAKGVRGSKPLLVLEPDAIPFYDEGACSNAGGRLKLMKFSSQQLSKAGAWVYLDAGHSDWTPWKDRWKMLRKAGVAHARGFSTNVSNFRPLKDEHKYAKYMVRKLRKAGVKGVKYVVDTSRNGAKKPVSGDVINPTWARIGAAPKLRFKGAFDGTLWIKHPGESDGTTNGGPSSGQWCDLLADRLLGRKDEGQGC